MSDTTYAFDPIGDNPANLVKAEPHNLSPANSEPYRILLPHAAPFHITNLKVVHVTSQGQRVPLTENVHWRLTLLYRGATEALRKVVYGGIRILDPNIEGMVEIDYQTLGDKWVADKDYVLARLAESNYNDRMTWWDNLTNVQDLFPPIAHPLPAQDVKGMSELIESIMAIVDKIGTTDGSTTPFAKHLFNLNDPHQTLPAVLAAIENDTLWVDALKRAVGQVTLDKLATASQLASGTFDENTQKGILTLGVLIGALTSRDTDLATKLRLTLCASKAEVDGQLNSNGLVTMTQLNQILSGYQKKP